MSTFWTLTVFAVPHSNIRACATRYRPRIRNRELKIAFWAYQDSNQFLLTVQFSNKILYDKLFNISLSHFLIRGYTMSKGNKKATKQTALGAMLIAIGIVLAPIFWFPFLGAKAYPMQHTINAIGGVFLGPIWATFIALVIGLVRNALGAGTIYAMPGGIPGGIIVGLFYFLIIRAGREKYGNLAALTEFIGTVFIGATLSVYIVAPWIGDFQSVGALIPFWVAFAASSIPGSIIGFIILQVLKVGGIDRDYFR